MRTRTAVINKEKQVEIQEIELGPLQDRQVMIKVKACAICTWEQRFYKGSAPEDYPFRGGHEVAGEVIEIGKQAICDAKVGDAVVIASKIRCGVCDSCRRYMDNFCENSDEVHLPGESWGPGGLSEYMVVQDYEVYKAASGLDFAELALSEPVACVSRSVNTPQISFGDNVLVQGAGIMGLLHVVLLKKRGVRIIMSEPDEGRRKMALDLGADDVLNPLENDFADKIAAITRGKGLNAVFFTAGGAKAVEQAMPLLSKRGWLCLYGSVHPKAPIQIDPNYIHYSELFLTGTFSHTKDSFRQAVDLLSQRVINVKPFVSERYAFDDIQQAFERAISPDTYRVVVTFD